MAYLADAMQFEKGGMGVSTMSSSFAKKHGRDAHATSKSECFEI